MRVHLVCRTRLGFGHFAPVGEDEAGGELGLARASERRHVVDVVVVVVLLYAQLCPLGVAHPVVVNRLAVV